MKTLAIDISSPHRKVIDETVDILRSGGVIIYPTDTCYGIGCDPAIPEAVEKIYQMKQRDPQKANSVIIKNLDQLRRFTHLTPPIEKILRDYLPGPYSFLIQNLDFRICPLNAVMIRKPNNRLTQAIADAFNAPFTTTSANLSGEPPAYSVKDLEIGLLNPDTLTVAPDLILDGGTLPPNPPSTMVDLTQWPPKVLRQGGAPYPKS